ncbi:MAG: hypothetical protein ACR2HJ_04840 [Fimbriimonadales bacterium]
MLIYLACQFDPTGIPYSRFDDPNSHPYVSLKEHPGALDELPEPKREPALREALELLNRTDSALESVGCEAWKADDERSGDGTQQVFRQGSYLALIFSHEQVGHQYSDWFHVFVRLAKGLASEPEQKQAMQVNFIIKPFLMHSTNRTGWQLELWIDARWSTAESARQQWEAYLLRVSESLFHIANEFQSEVLAEHPES